MIKTMINRILSRTLWLFMAAFGLAACSPISLNNLPIQLPTLPQIYPGTAQQPRPAYVQPQRQQAVQAARPVPQAGALTAAAPVARRAPPVPAARPQPPAAAPGVAPVQQARRPAAQVAVPPRLAPARQARPATANASAYGYRPPNVRAIQTPAPAYNSANARPNPARQQAGQSYSKRRPIWEENTPRAPVVPGKSATVSRPSAAVRRPVVSQKAPVMKPAPQVSARAPVKPVVQTPSADTASAPEVLDLSGTRVNTAQSTAAAATQPRSYTSSPAVTVLTKQANNQLSAGQAGRAAATLERALRIDPDNPLLWLRLAEANAQQGNNSQAASMARKALNLAPDDAALQARGKRLLNE